MRFSFWWAASCHLVRDAIGSTQQLSSHMEMSNRGLQKFIWYSFLSGGSSGAVWCYDEGTGAPLLREGLPGTGTACPGRLGDLPPWRCSQKPPGHGHVQKAVGNPAWAGGSDHLSYPEILWFPGGFRPKVPPCSIQHQQENEASFCPSEPAHLQVFEKTEGWGSTGSTKIASIIRTHNLNALFKPARGNFTQL